MTENQANILDTLWTPLPVPKFNIWDSILYSYSWDYFLYKIEWIKFRKCSDWYSVEYDTYNSIISEENIILAIKK